MSIQLSATRIALEAVVAAFTDKTGDELQKTCNYYVDLAKEEVENAIPPGRRKRALHTGGFLVQS